MTKVRSNSSLKKSPRLIFQSMLSSDTRRDTCINASLKTGKRARRSYKCNILAAQPFPSPRSLLGAFTFLLDFLRVALDNILWNISLGDFFKLEFDLTFVIHGAKQV